MTQPQGGPHFFQGDTGAPEGYYAVVQFGYSQRTQFADTYRYLHNLQKCGLWHKCLHCDLLDGKHGPALMVAINADASTWDATAFDDADVDHPNFNDTTPTVPTGGLNVKWQSDSDSYVSAYVPFSGLSTVTIASNDKLVLTDTSDSENPRRGLVSDIVALAAPLNSPFITVGNDATLTGERAIAFGAGLQGSDGGANSSYTISPANDLAALEALDATAGILVKTGAEAYARRSLETTLNKGLGVTNASGASANPSLYIDTANLASATVASADSMLIEDADDSLPKKAALSGLAAAINAVTAASAFAAANRALVAGGADRSADDSDFTMTQNGTKSLGTHDGTSMTIAVDTTISGTLASGHTTVTATEDAAALNAGVDATDGPYEKVYFGDHTTAGTGSAETVIAITKPAAESAITLFVELTGPRSGGANKSFHAEYVVAYYDNGGTLTFGEIIRSASSTYSGVAPTVSFDASGNDMRLRFTDDGFVYRLGVKVRVQWRTESA